MLWNGWAAGRGAERRSGAQLVISPMPPGLLEALWVPGGKRENEWKHPQRGVPWRESWDERTSLWEKLGGVRAALGNQKNCSLKEGFPLVYVSLECTKV